MEASDGGTPPEAYYATGFNPRSAAERSLAATIGPTNAAWECSDAATGTKKRRSRDRVAGLLDASVGQLRPAGYSPNTGAAGDRRDSMAESPWAQYQPRTALFPNESQ